MGRGWQPGQCGCPGPQRLLGLSTLAEARPHPGLLHGQSDTRRGIGGNGQALLRQVEGLAGLVVDQGEPGQQLKRPGHDLLVACGSAELEGGVAAVLGGGLVAGAVLVLGQLFGGVTSDPPSWVVAGATLAVAALFRPTRRRLQQAVDLHFNRRKYNAAQTVQAFSTRLRDQIDLDTLSAELLAVVDQTMEPIRVSFWLRPSPPGSSGTARNEARPTSSAY
jgi:hypothetical protein